MTLWEVGSWRKLEHKENAGWRLAFSQDGRYLALAPAFGNVVVWDFQAPTSLREVMRTEDGASAVTFSDDGRLLATASWSPGGIVQIWNIEKKKKIAEMKSGSSAIAFSRDGALLASADRELLRVWSVARQQEVARVFYNNAFGEAVAFTSEGDRVAIITGVQGVKDADVVLESWESLASMGKVYTYLSGGRPFHSPDGKYVWKEALGVATIYEAATGKEIANLAKTGLKVTAFSPNSKYVAAAGWNSAQVWDTETWQEVGPELEHSKSWGDKIERLKFSRDGKYLATVASDHTVRFWQVMDGQALGSLEHEGRNFILEFDPRGEVVLTASGGSGVEVWKIEDGQKLLDLPHEGARDIRYSPDGSMVASRGVGGMVKVWRHNKEIWSVDLGGAVRAMVFDPQGKFLAVGGSQDIALILNLDTGKIRRIDQVSSVDSFAFHPSGDYLATVHGSTRVWQLWPEIKEVAHISYATRGFSRDGKYLLGPESLLPWRPEDLLKEARVRLGSWLSQEKLDEYTAGKEYELTFLDAKGSIWGQSKYLGSE